MDLFNSVIDLSVNKKKQKSENKNTVSGFTEQDNNSNNNGFYNSNNKYLNSKSCKYWVGN